MDFETGIESIKAVSFSAEGKYFLRGDYLYFVEFEERYPIQRCVLRKYGILNNQTITVSQPMGNYNVDKNSMYTIYRLVCEGMNDNKYVCIFSYEDASTPGIIGFDCFWINVDGESEAKIRKFFIWRRRIYQIEQYRGKIIYVDADKDYSLTTLDFETDKKHVILKGFGKK